MEFRKECWFNSGQGARSFSQSFGEHDLSSTFSEIDVDFHLVRLHFHERTTSWCALATKMRGADRSDCTLLHPAEGVVPELVCNRVPSVSVEVGRNTYSFNRFAPRIKHATGNDATSVRSGSITAGTQHFEIANFQRISISCVQQLKLHRANFPQNQREFGLGPVLRPSQVVLRNCHGVPFLRVSMSSKKRVGVAGRRIVRWRFRKGNAYAIIAFKNDGRMTTRSATI